MKPKIEAEELEKIKNKIINYIDIKLDFNTKS